MIEQLAAALGAQVVETHISWVLLTEHDAYKIKKPVRLPFVDYGTLASRHAFCEEEVRLNRRLAPSLYLGVERITGSMSHPRLGGRGRAIDYAVHMRRFPAGALFSEMLEAGALHAAHVDALARVVAEFHGSLLPVPRRHGFATPRRRLAAASAALHGLRGQMLLHEYEKLRDWLANESARLAPLWRDRLEQGFVRECHGDLHLSNIVFVDEAVVAFDGVEFNKALRLIDVLDDIAFPVMDFEARGRPDFAWRLLNAWLDHTGDHMACAGLRFAACYRALVRAQAAVHRGAPGGVRVYEAAALRWAGAAPPYHTRTHGMPG